MNDKRTLLESTQQQKIRSWSIHDQSSSKAAFIFRSPKKIEFGNWPDAGMLRFQACCPTAPTDGTVRLRRPVWQHFEIRSTNDGPAILLYCKFLFLLLAACVSTAIIIDEGTVCSWKYFGFGDRSRLPIGIKSSGMSNPGHKALCVSFQASKHVFFCFP